MRYKCLACGRVTERLGWIEHEDGEKLTKDQFDSLFDSGWRTIEHEDGRDYCYCIKCGVEDPPIDYVENGEKLTKEQFDSLFDSGWRV